MKNEDRKAEIQCIAHHLMIVMEDLCNRRDKLEEIRCVTESKKLDVVIGKVYDLAQILYNKSEALKK